MLEDTRKRGATIAIYVIFGILIAVFVFSFGPGANQQSQGCSFASSKPTLLTIDGNKYGMSSWQWALNTRDGSESGQAGIQRKIAAMDLLVRRELLAMEAERRGLVIADSIIDEKLKRGELYILTQRLDGTRAFFEDGQYFNYKYLERWIGQFGLSIGSFKAEQRRELLAQAMLDELRAGAHVTRDETFSLWVHANTDVTLDAVAFPVETYKSKIVLGDADVDRFLADHEAEVKKKYEDDKPLNYTATPAKVHLHRVFVARTPTEKKDEPAPPEGSGSGTGTAAGSGSGTAADPATGSGSGSAAGTGTGTGSGSGTAVVEEKPDPARAKLVKARAAILAKTKKFGDVAKELDADEATRNKSGDLGWVSVDAPGLGKEVAAAVKLLTVPGDPSEIIDTPEGFWLVWGTEKREGDLTYDQVKREIASALAAEHWAREAARRDALAALNDARAGKGKNLADMFEKAPEAQRPDRGGGGGLEELKRNIEEQLLDPATSDEEKQQLREILENIDNGTLGAPSGPTGMTDFTYDELASWGQDDAAPGDVGPVGAPDPAPAEDINAPPSKDPLPKFVGVPKAQVQRIGPMPRDTEAIADLGKSKELITALFDELDEGALATKLYLVKLTDMGITGGDAFVIVQVIAKGKPELDKFDEQEASLRDSMESDRADAIVSGWLTERCKKLSDLGKIKPAQDAMLVQQDGQQKAIPYTPCGGLE